MLEPIMTTATTCVSPREPWNKGKLVGQKAPLRLRDIWAIRIRIQLAGNIRALALFNLAINSKLRSCDQIKVKVRDIAHGELVSRRAILLQQKTPAPRAVRYHWQLRLGHTKLESQPAVDRCA